MRGHGITHPGKFYIRQPIFLASLPDDLADGRIMDMGYFGEKMMFDLEVQSPHQPGNDWVVSGEISRGTDLVYGPFVLQSARFDIGDREGGMLYGMCQLEYEAQHEPGDAREYHEADQPVQEPELIDRQENEQEGMDQFKTPEDQVIGKLHFLQRHIAHFVLKIFLVIQHEDPEYI